LNVPGPRRFRTPAALGTEQVVVTALLVVGGIGACSTESVAVPPQAAEVFIAAQATPPGERVVASDNWSAYSTDADLRGAYSGRKGTIWNFGGVDWSKISLVPDPVFGKVLRLGFPQQSPFYDLASFPRGKPGSVMRLRVKLPAPMEALWVRGRFKFEYDASKQPYGWATKSPNDPSPLGGSYKLFFLHWEAPYSERGSLVYTNSKRLDFEYYITKLTKTGRRIGGGKAHGLNESTAPEFSNREWYEFVFLHRQTGPTTTQAGSWVRRLTTRGGSVEHPGPWMWTLQEYRFSGNVPRASYLEFGGNKNHGNEFDQWVLWGPWEVVDARAHANPFSVPGA
jgi:hypothetical protein